MCESTLSYLNMASTNQTSTRTSSSVVVPPLIIPPRLNNPSQLTVNRYQTVVSVEVYNGDNLRQIKWFSDIQMAWIWIKDQTLLLETVEWDITSFIPCADEMDSQWRYGHGENGICVATGGQYEFMAYYEPTTDYEDVRGHEEFY